MKTTALLNAFLLASVRSGLQGLLASFQLPGTDPCALPYADGPNALEVDRLPNSGPNEPKETGGGVGTLSPRKPAGEPPPPIRLGVHPDITRAYWKAAPRNRRIVTVWLTRHLSDPWVAKKESSAMTSKTPTSPLDAEPKRLPSMTPDTIRSYAELQTLIRVALRCQHPEWVEPNGDSPICDAYEARFAELLNLTPPPKNATNK